MVGLALVHFAVVELKPVIAAGMSSLSICRTMFKNTYKNQVPCTCNDGCTQQDTIEEQDQMLQTAMTSFTPGFHQEGDCTRVRVDNAHFASVFYYLLVVSWAVVLFSCVVMFLVEAFKRRFSSVASGAYLVFTLELEHRCLYRVILRSWTVLFVVVFITGLVSMISHNVDFHLVWVIVQSEIIPIFVLLASMHHLLSPTNLKEFSAWDLEKMRQIRFRRSWSDIFVDSNDNLYHRIGRILTKGTELCEPSTPRNHVEIFHDDMAMGHQLLFLTHVLQISSAPLCLFRNYPSAAITVV
eukprot:Skav200663  [mRNA]  locus=scaffold6804:26052:26942:- [translate_table: standard]